MGDRSRPSVLIADDDALIRATLGMVAERQGMRVVNVADGSALLASAQEDGPYDLCIMDVSMPGPSLADRLQRLRGIAPGMPVVVLSGHPVDDHNLGDQNGVHYIVKPVDLTVLTGILRRAAERSASSRR